MQGKRVRAAGGQFLCQKLLIKRKGALPALELRVERFAEPPRPHFHFTTSNFVIGACLINPREETAPLKQRKLERATQPNSKQ
jgi:hypothetical protein